MSRLFAELDKPGLRVQEKPKSADDIACPKCRFTGTGEPQMDGWRKTLYLSPANIQIHNFLDLEGRQLKESLFVACARCGFSWREDVSNEEAEEQVS